MSDDILMDADGDDYIDPVAEYHEHVSAAKRRFQKLQKRNKSLIGDFLGDAPRHKQAILFPFYFEGVFAWAVQRCIERGGWEVSGKLGYREEDPHFSEVETGLSKKEKLVTNGQLFLTREKSKLVVTVDISHRADALTIGVEGLARQKKGIETFVNAVEKIAKEENFFRGQKLNFCGTIEFLDIKPRAWDTVILSDEYKKEIRANTVEFLREAKLWEELGVPTKRGLMLAGEPGTGKTIVCRAIMGEAEGITCITTGAYALGEREYISLLYTVAQELSPCIVLIEDVDLIGQVDSDYGGHRNPALVSLLDAMDGVEPRKEVVTVATTNCFALLDKALSQRPSRFDRVIQFTVPNSAERGILIDSLCQKIKLNEITKEYIARHTAGFTPAQIQEVVFGLAIEYRRDIGIVEIQTGDMDRIISRINVTKNKQFGFNHVGNVEGVNLRNQASQNEASAKEKKG